jgi:hypothetical protein
VGWILLDLNGEGLHEEHGVATWNFKTYENKEISAFQGVRAYRFFFVIAKENLYSSTHRIQDRRMILKYSQFSLLVLRDEMAIDGVWIGN